MEITQIYTILGIAVGIVSIISGIVFWLINKLDNDIKSLRTSVEGINTSMNGWIQHMTAMQSEQSKRTDRLYQMFVDLLEKGK
jgi:CHASE3 domain sensor protein